MIPRNLQWFLAKNVDLRGGEHIYIYIYIYIYVYRSMHLYYIILYHTILYHFIIYYIILYGYSQIHASVYVAVQAHAL